MLAAAVAEAMRPDATAESVVEVTLRLAKDATRTAIEAVARGRGARSTAGATAGSRRCAPRSRRSTRSASTTRGPRRTPASRAACTRSRRSRSRSACSSRRAATTPRRCSAASTTAATPTRSRRWAARSPAALGSPVPREWIDEVGDGEQARPRGAGPHDGRGRRGDLCEGPGALRGAGGGLRHRGARLRVTWIQPEDLVGHELRQAREEGKDVDAVEERWFAAGGAPAPGRGASQEPVAAGAAAARARAARRARRAAAAARRGRAGRAGDRRRRPGPGAPDLDRIRGAWLGRAAGCVLGKPVENIPREGIRAIAQGTGNWPVRGWFTAEGLDPAVTERCPWNKASKPTSLAENIDGIPEDDDLNFTMLAVVLLERAGPDFSSVDVAKLWLDYLPPGRIFTAERVAMRNLLEGYLPPQTATRRNPFREWIGARLRVDVYGWCARGDPVARRAHGVRGREAQPHRERRLRRDVDGGGARRVALGGRRGRVRRRRARRRPASEPARRGAALRARARRRVGGARRRALRALRRLPLGARDQQHRARRGGACTPSTTSRRRSAASSRAAWTPTRTAPRSARSSARSAPIERRWSEPLHGRFSSSLPGFDGITLDELAARTLAVA